MNVCCLNQSVYGGFFNSSLSWLRQGLSTSLIQLKCKTLHPTDCSVHILIKQHGLVFKVDHMLRHKRSFRKFKRIEIIPGFFSGHCWIGSEISNRKKSGKSPYIWKLSSTLLNNSWIKEDITRAIFKILNRMKIKTTY